MNLTEEFISQNIRPRFSRVLARDEIYFANHSLGRPLDQMEDDVREGLAHWYVDMDSAWEAWMNEAARFESNLKSIIRWHPDGAVVPKANVGQALRAVLNALPKRPIRVVTSRSEFDSVDFVLKAYAERGLVSVDWIEPSSQEQGVPKFDAGDFLGAIQPGVDLVIVSLVIFNTGQVMPGVKELIDQAHQVGAKVFLDTYHAAGVMELDFAEADFAAGGCYKYLRGGPGACWLALNPRHLDGNMNTLDTGWFAKRNTFGYQRTDKAEREIGGRGWWDSTPAVLPWYQARSGLEFTNELGVGSVRAYGLKQLEKLRQILAPFGGFQPSIPAEWGAFALLPSPNTDALVTELKRMGVNVDARQGVVRFGPDLLNTEAEIQSLTGKLQTVFAGVGAV